MLSLQRVTERLCLAIGWSIVQKAPLYVVHQENCWLSLAPHLATSDPLF